jgi:hypothetical protein
LALCLCFQIFLAEIGKQLEPLQSRRRVAALKSNRSKTRKARGLILLERHCASICGFNQSGRPLLQPFVAQHLRGCIKPFNTRRIDSFHIGTVLNSDQLPEKGLG